MARSRLACSTQMRARGPSPTRAAAVILPRAIHVLTADGLTPRASAYWPFVITVRTGLHRSFAATREVHTFKKLVLLENQNAFGCRVSGASGRTRGDRALDQIRSSTIWPRRRA